MQYNQEGFGTVETLSSLSAENGRGRGFDSLGGLAIYPHPIPHCEERGGHQRAAHQCCPPRQVLLTSWAQSPVRSRNTHSGLQPAAQRDPQPPHPSLLMCALDVCLSLSKNCKTSVQLGDRNPGRKQTHLEGGCSKPHTPSESQIPTGLQ